ADGEALGTGSQIPADIRIARLCAAFFDKTTIMIELTITPPGHPLSGKVEPPGSKSITNRALLLAGLAKGKSRLTGALKSDDTLFMAKALRAMGVSVTEPD